MNRLPIYVASLALGLAMLNGVAAQDTAPPPTVDTSANGGYSVADPSNPIVVGEGEVRVYGDIATGGTGGEVLGDPAGLASIQSHDSIVNSVPPPDLNPDSGNLVSGPPVAPAPADSTTTTTAETTSGDGSTSTDGASAPVEGTTTGTTTTAAPDACAAYGTWYDAQVAYEAAGGVSGDPGVVAAVDPDYDGVACEHLIVY
jgi:hypothetical protein